MIITLLPSLHLIIFLFVPVIISITTRYKQVSNNIFQLIRTLILMILRDFAFCDNHGVPLPVHGLPGEQLQHAPQLQHLVIMLCPGLQYSIDRKEKVLTVRNPVWMVSTAQ